MRWVVKARQARRVLSNGMRGVCFSLNPTNFIGFRLGFWFAPVKRFPRKWGAVGFFKLVSR